VDGEQLSRSNHEDKDRDSPLDIEEGHMLLCLLDSLDRATGVFCTLCAANSSPLKLWDISLIALPSLLYSLSPLLTGTSSWLFSSNDCRR
jgi:hypothetical protein